MDKVCYLCFNCPSKEKKVAFISWTQDLFDRINIDRITIFDAYFIIKAIGSYQICEWENNVSIKYVIIQKLQPNNEKNKDNINANIYSL